MRSYQQCGKIQRLKNYFKTQRAQTEARSLKGFVSLVDLNLSSCAHLWSSASVDVNTDGTVRAATAHEQMGPVVRLHHPDEVPTAVLEKGTEKQKGDKFKSSVGETKQQEDVTGIPNVEPAVGPFLAPNFDGPVCKFLLKLLTVVYL